MVGLYLKTKFKIMKKIFTVVMMITGFITYSFAQKTTDFRTFNWGTSFKQVQDNEKATFLLKDKDDMLQYQDDLAGYDCAVLYGFNENDKLISGNYVFTKKYSNPQLYIQDYTTFKNLLVQKYGKPASEKEDWNTNIATEKQNYGQAVADGNLTINTEWVTGRSIIQISLTSFDKRPSLHIHYTSKSLDELENKEVLQKALTKL